MERNTVNLDMDHQEEDLALSRSSSADTQFDIIIGHIEDIIMEDEFQSIQNDFMEKFYQEFEDTEENKFSYTDIHKEYTQLIENYLTQQLRQRVPQFSMEDFQRQLISRQGELEGEVFEMLVTFSDFLAFKEMMLDYRAEKEGKIVDLSLGFKVTSLSAPGSESSASASNNTKSSQNNGPIPRPSHRDPLSRFDCGEPMVEGTDTPRSSMEASASGPSNPSSQHTPLLDRVEITEDTPMESPR